MTGWLRRNRALLVITLGTLSALVVAALIAGGPRTAADHDPENPGARGARALARVLAQEGVEVDVVRSADALEEQTLDQDTTVLVTTPANLGRSTAHRLLRAAAQSNIVVVGAEPGAVEALGVDASVDTTSPRRALPAQCTDLGLGDLSGLEIEVDEAASYATSTGCFASGSGWLLASADRGLALLGAAGIVENDQITRADNAAAALRLLGQRPRVVWYVPSLDDLGGHDGVSLRSLLPPWLRPATWLLGVVALALILWRGRRLGPLASEPLPVSIRSLETTEARGRLYRSASARGHAAEVLRRSTRESIAAHLRVPPSDVASLLRDVGARLDRPAADLEPLIGDGVTPPRSDTELIRLANALADLDREVHRT